MLSVEDLEAVAALLCARPDATIAETVRRVQDLATFAEVTEQPIGDVADWLREEWPAA